MLSRFLLPNTDLEVSQISLGTATFGLKQTEEEAFALMDRYLELGGNFLDTARVYSDWVPGEKGRSERIIGDWLKATRRREEVVLATKGLHYEWSDKSLNRVNAACARHDIERSLEVLGIEQIDLYWLHRDKLDSPVEEIVDFMQVFLAEGKIRHMGVANWSGGRLKAANDYAARAGLAGFVASQPLFNVGAWNLKPGGDPTMAVLDEFGYNYHRESGVALIPYSAQAQGFFSKATGETHLDAEALQKSRYTTPENLELAKVIGEIAAEKGCNANGVVLGYLTAQPFPVVPIVGAYNEFLLEDSALAMDVRLSGEELERLEQCGV